MERPAQGFLTYELQLDNITLPPAPERDASAMEWLAYFVCSKRSCTTDDLRRLCQLLPSQTSAKRRRTTTSDGGTGRSQRSFSVGAYSAGGCHGIQCNTFNFPWTACWLASMVQAAAPSHRYSTCTLLHNVMHYRHTDSRNAPNTTNLIIPCDFWRGGAALGCQPPRFHPFGLHLRARVVAGDCQTLCDSRPVDPARDLSVVTWRQTYSGCSPCAWTESPHTRSEINLNWFWFSAASSV